MDENGLYASHLHAWAPGLSSADDWRKWAAGERQIASSTEAPKLEFTEPLFRRRLSQISRMAVHVMHDVVEEFPAAAELKQVFISLRGEIGRELAINRGLIEDGEILPAGFSLSVFNTPVALATIALTLRGGYSAVYPSQGRFSAALQGACAPILSGAEKAVVLVYADEYVPDEYGALQPVPNEPFAFAAVLGCGQTDGAVPLPPAGAVPDSPAEFLRTLLNG